jgi:polysaccharide biosynthesis/export protein
MNHNPSLRGLWLGLTLVLASLTGCALAPGMHFQVAQDTTGGADAPDILLQAIEPKTIQALRSQRLEQLQTLQELVSAAQPYTIGAGDVLGITVWDHPQLLMPGLAASGNSQESGTIPHGYLVSEEGTIQFPYVGNLKVQGLTAKQAREALIQPLSVYIRKPQITLRVQAYRSQKIYIDGEVRNPGQHFITENPMSLAEALARAGTSTASADTSRISIVRQGRQYSADLPGLIQAGINPASIMLNNGDLVRVAHRDETKIAVLGEIMRPGSMPMRNGRLSLADALSEAGGLNVNSADARQVYVIRGAGLEEAPSVYHINTRSPAMLAMADQFPLQAKDIVYVDTAPLAMWNRVISLILPTGVLTRTTADTVDVVR